MQRPRWHCWHRRKAPAGAMTLWQTIPPPLLPARRENACPGTIPDLSPARAQQDHGPGYESRLPVRLRHSVRRSALPGGDRPLRAALRQRPGPVGQLEQGSGQPIGPGAG
ncbi:hypothetical protein G6F22_019286 [Rhizopus arrhizus]|nr:hypothetical protein G6F22_019286 [Rhizopus arrhizus]